MCDKADHTHTMDEGDGPAQPQEIDALLGNEAPQSCQLANEAIDSASAIDQLPAQPASFLPPIDDNYFDADGASTNIEMDTYPSNFAAATPSLSRLTPASASECMTHSDPLKHEALPPFLALTNTPLPRLQLPIARFYPVPPSPTLVLQSHAYQRPVTPPAARLEYKFDEMKYQMHKQGAGQLVTGRWAGLRWDDDDSVNGDYSMGSNRWPSGGLSGGGVECTSISGECEDEKEGDSVTKRRKTGPLSKSSWSGQQMAWKRVLQTPSI